MNNYQLEVWFRYGKFEKDFEIIEIDADSDDEAIFLAREIKHWVFSVKILSKNGIKNE